VNTESNRRDRLPYYCGNSSPSIGQFDGKNFHGRCSHRTVSTKPMRVAIAKKTSQQTASLEKLPLIAENTRGKGIGGI
jgi:hypothetical protein